MDASAATSQAVLAEPPARRGGRGLRTLILLIGAALLFLALYAAAGYLLAPRLIDREARAWTREKLGLELGLGQIKVDPFRFTVSIADIALPAASPMVSARTLELDFAARTLFSESRRFDSIRLVAPRVNAEIGPDGTLNLLKLVPPPNPDPLPAVLIADFRVEDGAARFADLSKPNRPETRLAPLGFRLQNLHTLRDEGGGFRLTGQSDEGELFVLRGKASLAPIASHGGLAVRGLRAATVQEHFADLLPVVLADGRIDFDLAYMARYGDAGLKAAAELPGVTLSGFRVEGTPETLNGRVALGAVALAGIRADAAMPAGGAMTSSWSLGSLGLRDVAVEGTGPATGQRVTLKAADVGDIRIDPATGGLILGLLRVSGVDTTVTRDARGGISLLKLLPTRPVSTAYAAETPNPEIGEFSLSDARIRFVDQAVRPASTWTVTPLTVTARSAASGQGALDLVAEGRVNGATAFRVSGNVDPATPSADLAVRVSGLPVKAITPYSVDFPRLDIVSGTASADGRLRYGPRATGYTGSAAIDDLRLIETYQRSNLVAWKRLALTGIEATPKGATIERVQMSAPATTLLILQDGTLNFQRLVTMNPTPVVTPAADAAPPPKLTRAERREQQRAAAAEKAATAAEARAALAAPIVEPAFPVTVKRVDISQGTLDFADFSLRPNFGAKVEGVTGTVSNLSNSPRAVAQVKLAGYVTDKFSPVTIQGELTPLQYDRRTNVDMAFRNIELPVFNPYSGRWAGYSIAKGKLTTELGYRIDNRALEASHHIVIDQLEWGEATDSKEKVSMPIKFATSLLKDKNGVIDLDVPVTGTLDDPSFRLGPIIWKVIGNLMEKVLTAPFRALGDLFGGKDDVQFVDFAPGSAVVPSEATSNLAGIARGLAEKPELRLDIPSGPGLPLDALSLADRKIAAAAMAKEVKKGQPADLATLELDTRHDRLEDLYRARMKSGAKYPDAPEGETRDARREREIAWLMEALRGSFAPTPDELATLGRARAEAVRLALLEGAPQVDPARLFLSGRDSASEKDGKARMELKLEGG